MPKPGFMTFRMPPDLLQSARERAAAEDRTLSATVRMAIREYVADDRKSDGDGKSKAPA